MQTVKSFSDGTDAEAHLLAYCGSSAHSYIGKTGAGVIHSVSVQRSKCEANPKRISPMGDREDYAAHPCPAVKKAIKKAIKKAMEEAYASHAERAEW